jgi:hypothetical protein
MEIKMITETTVLNNVNDFFDGFYDTAVKAPISFGDFLARISGYRDYQDNSGSVVPDLDSSVYQHQAFNELRVIYEALSHEQSRNLVKEALINDIQERPAYYLGGIGTTTGIGKTLYDSMLRNAYKAIITGTKVEQKIHELYGSVENFLNLSDEEFYKFINDNMGDTPCSPNIFGDIGDNVNSLWHAFKNWVAPRRDPLVLDLDGDGIETLGITSTTQVLFDYDEDGVKTGTGWIKGDDGFVVLDRNGNGTIDNGGELFGDQTLVNGAKASDGFAALSAEDTNHNGKFDAGDTNFTKVRIWQDTNSDGISQAGELHTLNELGTPQGGFSCFAIHLLTSINLTSTTSNNQNFNNTRRVA